VNGLHEVFERYGLLEGVPSTWQQECRVARCNIESATTAYFPRSNWITTHSRLLQESIQAKEIEAANKAVTEAAALWFSPEAEALIAGNYVPKPDWRDLGEADRYMRTLLRQQPSKEVAVDLAWVHLLRLHRDEAVTCLDRYNAWDLCPALRIYLADEFKDVGDEDRAFDLYRASVEFARSPKASAESGYLLLRRCGVTEPELTPFKNGRFRPDSLIHLRNLDPLTRAGFISSRSFQSNSEIARLAVRSYGRTVLFHWLAPGDGSDDDERQDDEILFALDGLALAFKTVGDWRAVKETCLEFLGCWDGSYGMEGDDELYFRCQTFLEEALRSLPGGHATLSEIRDRLLRELDWFDSLPRQAGAYLEQAEWQRASVSQPDHDLKSVVSYYCLAVEATLQSRLGEPIDRLLESQSTKLSEEFRDAFKRKNRKEWTKELSIGEYRRNLGEAFFKNGLSKVGADASFYFRELPGLLKKLPEDYRNPAAHHKARRTYAGDASAYSFSNREVSVCRSRVLEILSKMVDPKVLMPDEIRGA
jgi:hypothetical protein